MLKLVKGYTVCQSLPEFYNLLEITKVNSVILFFPFINLVKRVWYDIIYDSYKCHKLWQTCDILSYKYHIYHSHSHIIM